MELSTFGALLAFAIELEESAARFYRDAADGQDCEPVRETLLALARQNENRRKLLVATRQEHVTEMVLEPITGLNRSDYEIESQPPGGMTRTQVLAHAAEIERGAQRFYSDAAARGRDLLAGVARIFRRLAREKQNRARELGGLLSS